MAPAVEDKDPTLNDSQNNILSFSFGGCGFLGVYQVGVAACLKKHTDVLNQRKIRFSGASSGALVASAFLCDIDLGEMTKLLLDIGKTIKESENFQLDSCLRSLFEKYLPDDAHIRLRNRMYISVTFLNGIRAGLITNYRSREHLIQCLIATSFVPGHFGCWIPPTLDAEDFIDLSNGIPGSSTKEENNNCSLKSSKDAYLNCPEKKTEKGKLEKVIRLCGSSLGTTSKVIRRLPGGPAIVEKVNTWIFSYAVLLLHIFCRFSNIVDALVPGKRSKKYTIIDGGFSDNTPSFDSNTVKVTAFSGESDICPKDLTALDFNLDMGRCSMQLSEDNLLRLHHAINPMDTDLLLKLCEEGYDHCLRFLNQKELLSCKRHLMTRATIASSPCNIGHAHCRCDTCRSEDNEIRESLSCVDCHKAKQTALVSVLPDNVKRVFELAIKEEKNRITRPVSGWNMFQSALSWYEQMFYVCAFGLLDKAVNLQNWLLRCCDCMMSFAYYVYNQKGMI